MAHILEDQRAALIAGLGGDPLLQFLQHHELMFLYLGNVELRTELTLIERLKGWADANSIPLTLAWLQVGF